MPKVYITEQDRLNDRLRREILAQMARYSITQEQLAKKMGFKCALTFARRMERPDNFTRWELRTLYETLHIPKDILL